MAKWDETMKDLELEGRNPGNKMENYRSRCNCPTCPTYADCARQKCELTFCITKKSSCITEMKVCYCPNCPVHEELNLAFMYYCIRGNEGDQRNK
jgi:hypothetical protein